MLNFQCVLKSDYSLVCKLLWYAQHLWRILLNWSRTPKGKSPERPQNSTLQLYHHAVFFNRPSWRSASFRDSSVAPRPENCTDIPWGLKPVGLGSEQVLLMSFWTSAWMESWMLCEGILRVNFFSVGDVAAGIVTVLPVGMNGLGSLVKTLLIFSKPLARGLVGE